MTNRTIAKRLGTLEKDAASHDELDPNDLVLHETSPEMADLLRRLYQMRPDTFPPEKIDEMLKPKMIPRWMTKPMSKESHEILVARARNQP